VAWVGVPDARGVPGEPTGVAGGRVGVAAGAAEAATDGAVGLTAATCADVGEAVAATVGVVTVGVGGSIGWPGIVQAESTRVMLSRMSQKVEL
jgi:hypothetical protein